MSVGFAVAFAVAGGAVAGSRLAHRSTPRLGGGPAPVSYQVTYDVTQNGAHHWEVLTVHRPLAGSDLVYETAGPPRPGDQPAGGSVSTPTDLFAVNSLGVHGASGRQPGPPSGDELLSTEMPEMLRRGLADDRHSVRRVAGQACRMFRLAEPPSGAIVAVRSTAPDHDDVCLSGSGVLLAEEWTYHGSVVLQRTAINEQESVSSGLRAGSAPAAPGTDGATPPPRAAATVTTDPQVRSVLAAPPVPAGFASFGPPVAFRLPDPTSPSATAAMSAVWTFVNGGRVVTVEAGSTRGGQLPWQAGDTVTEPVVLRGLGDAQTAVRSDGAEVRVELGARGWVRVRGTIPMADLVAYAQGLALAAQSG